MKETQPETWAALEKLHGTGTETVLVDDLVKALDGASGALGVIRHGFKCFGKLVRAAYFAPAHGMNPDTQRLYQANRLTLTRQLRYSTKNENSIDMVIGLNGIPVATIELKNPMTGKTSSTPSTSTGSTETRARQFSTSNGGRSCTSRLIPTWHT